jgi:hypothetical protein
MIGIRAAASLCLALVLPTLAHAADPSADECAPLAVARQYLAAHYPSFRPSGTPFLQHVFNERNGSGWMAVFPIGTQPQPSGPLRAATVRLDDRSSTVIDANPDSWLLLPPGVPAVCAGGQPDLGTSPPK